MENDIIEVGNGEITSPITNQTLIGLAEQAERRIDAMNKIKQIAIKLTNRHDWTDQGGKPYLQVSGAEKIARMFGISWRISEPDKEFGEGGHYSFTYKGYFTLAGETIEAIGTRSSRDGFFKKYSGFGDNRVELPASEIDAGDVKKAAYTNCIGNGITRLLGIRNMTYEDLQEYAKITKDQLGKVDYKKKGKQQDGIASEDATTITSGISEVKRRTKKKDGTAMKSPLFVIVADGKEMTTFHESIAKTANEVRESGLQAKISFKSGTYGLELESITPIEPPEDDNREPGQEG